jgi:hypothetical protein
MPSSSHVARYCSARCRGEPAPSSWLRPDTTYNNLGTKVASEESVKTSHGGL